MNDDLPEMEDIPEVPDDEEEAAEPEDAVASEHPDAGTRARLAGLLAPLAPVAQRVPVPVLTGVGSGVLVALVVLLATAVLAGGGGSTTASAHGSEAPGAHLAHEDEEDHGTPVVKPPPKSIPPAGPTPTPTPVLWEQRGAGWIGHGMPGPDRGALLRPERFLFVDGGRESYTLRTRFAVLSASGERTPNFGFALSYRDDSYLFLESWAEGELRQPYMQLWWFREGLGGGPIGERVTVPGVPFWGRGTHELSVDVTPRVITATINGLPLGRWTNTSNVPTDGRIGPVVWFHTEMRFDLIRVD